MLRAAEVAGIPTSSRRVLRRMFAGPSGTRRGAGLRLAALHRLLFWLEDHDPTCASCWGTEHAPACAFELGFLRERIALAALAIRREFAHAG